VHSAVTKVQFKLRSRSLRIQRWYASAPEYKARLRIHERGLTLPSSGPAYGGPFKSNVRPRQNPHRENTFVIRRTARAIARNSCCRRRFTTRALRQVRFGLVVTGLRSPSVLRSQCTAVASRTLEMESTYLGTGSVLAQSQDAVALLLSRAQTPAVSRLRTAPKCKVNSGAGHAASPASLDMLRHPNENTNSM